MEQISILHYDNVEIRTIQIDGQPWWVLADVCKAMNMTTPSQVAARLDKDEKDMSVIHTLGGNQKVTIINEPGLYSVILKSDKPEAKPFKRWVTHEVLPMIRRQGFYSVKAEQITPDIAVEAAKVWAKCPKWKEFIIADLLRQGGFELEAVQDIASVKFIQDEERKGFSQRIQEALDTTGLSLNRLSKEIGMREDTMQQYYRQKKFPRYERYIDLVKRIEQVVIAYDTPMLAEKMK